MSWEATFKILDFALRKTPLLKKAHHQARGYLRLRIPLNPYRHFHNEIMHRVLEMEASVEQYEVSRIATDILDKACSMLAFTLSEQADVSRKGTHNLCASIKLFVGKEEPRLATWVRCRNSVGRPVSNDFSDIEGNSVFASLLGRDDGKVRWPRLRCFACGNLPDQPRYANSRGEEYRKWYGATMAFPLMVDSGSIIGFLCFDSPKAGFFGDLPNAYEFIERPMDYHDELESCNLYHLGGLIADVMAVSLGRCQNSAINQIVENKGEVANGQCIRSSEASVRNSP